MSDANTSKDNVEVGDGNNLEESTITMVEWLEEQKEMEDEYAAVLGASDEKACTYAKGAIKRQALYSCLTCCPEAKTDLKKSAGVCLACSYRCHENHELVELYTKRNFRCDCPTLRLGSEKRCALNAQLEEVQPENAGNTYNQNFQGLYCKCKRPYPDPERTTEEVMLQCAVCEDWFHLPHLEAPAASEKWLDTCSEMICDTCMEKHDFLGDYTGLALQQVEKGKEEDVSVAEKPKEAPPTEATAPAEDTTPNAEELLEPPANKRPKLADEAASDCSRPSTKKIHKGAAFWTADWRKALCRCSACLDLYKQQNVEFLLDLEDSAKSYEERGMKRAAETSSYEQSMNALASLDRTVQIEAISEYNNLKEKLKEFFQSFAANKKVVTEEDIKNFFATMRNENNSNLAKQPYFCR